MLDDSDTTSALGGTENDGISVARLVVVGTLLLGAWVLPGFLLKMVATVVAVAVWHKASARGIMLAVMFGVLAVMLMALAGQ